MAELAILEAPPVSRAYGIVEFRAMASPCRIVTDDDRLARAGEALVHDLERRWSRFLRTSEVSRLNDSGGAPCIVSAETFRLIELAQLARERTRGAFNPLVLDRLEELGYGPAGATRPQPARSPVATGSAGVSTEPIELLPGSHAVRLPTETRFDPGGIGKGLAGDLVVDHLLGLGADTVQVELGGDVRLHGENWTGGDWIVTVQEPACRDRAAGHVILPAGAVATSSSVATTWRSGTTELHHLIDPSTGWPSDTDLAAVTATSSELWWAEVVAKVALMAGTEGAARTMHEFGASGVLVGRDGSVSRVAGEDDR